MNQWPNHGGGWQPHGGQWQQQPQWGGYQAPPPSGGGLTTGQKVALAAGAVALLILISAGVGGASKKKDGATSATPRAVAAWAQELRSILDSERGGRVDPTCRKFKCTEHATSLGSVQRVESKSLSTGRKLTVPRALSPWEAGRPSVLTPCHTSTRQMWLVYDGPLAGHVFVIAGNETQIATPAYFLPSADSGFGTAERECVWSRLR